MSTAFREYYVAACAEAQHKDAGQKRSSGEHHQRKKKSVGATSSKNNDSKKPSSPSKKKNSSRKGRFTLITIVSDLTVSLVEEEALSLRKTREQHLRH